MTPVRLESAIPRSRIKHSIFVFNMYLIRVLTVKLSEKRKSGTASMTTDSQWNNWGGLDIAILEYAEYTRTAI